MARYVVCATEPDVRRPAKPVKTRQAEHGARLARDKRVLDLDASEWTSRLDLYRAVLPCLGAPDWHSYSQDALVESMVWGEINAVGPPYMLSISGTARLPSDLLAQLRCLKEHVEEARAEHNVRLGGDVEVSVELLP